MGGRQCNLRCKKNPKCDWKDSDASPLYEDTIGKPYGVRGENGHRLEHTSIDENGEYYVGDIMRKKGTMCTQERDCGGLNALSNSGLTLDSTTKPKVPSLVTLPLIPPFPNLFPTSSMKTDLKTYCPYLSKYGQHYRKCPRKTSIHFWQIQVLKTLEPFWNYWRSILVCVLVRHIQ